MKTLLRSMVPRRFGFWAAVNATTALAAVSLAAAQVQLSTPVFYNAGAIPVSLAVSDLDGDGDADLAVINLQGHLRVLLNDGAGCFTSTLRLDHLWPASSVGSWPGYPSILDVEATDLDADGRVDLAVTLPEFDGFVSVVRNPGDARFASPESFGGCAHMKNATAADFNGDGFNDLAVTSNCFKATILLNDGAGRFTPSGSFGTGYTSGEIAAGDLDGDRLPDIAFLNIGISNVTFLRNDGGGTFSPLGGAVTGDNPHDLVLADLDGDGDRDVATANYYSGDVSILLNDGWGLFLDRRTYPAGSLPEGLAAGDLDGDGLKDLAVVNSGGNDLAVLTNLGDGAFSAPARVGLGNRPNDVALADLNRDGTLDVIGLNLRSENVAVVLNGEANACPVPDPEPPNPIIVPISTQTAVDGSRRLVFVYWGTDVRSDDVVIWRNGKRLLRTVNDSYHWDDVTRIKGKSFTYRVCETDSFSSCSADSSVSF